jgi:hypothetical protein
MVLSVVFSSIHEVSAGMYRAGRLVVHDIVTRKYSFLALACLP